MHGATRAADTSRLAASAASIRYGPTAATRTLPRANPVTTAVWLTVRSSERPTGNRSSSGSWVRLAVRAPCVTGATKPVLSSRSSSAATGRPGRSMAATQAAASRSQPDRAVPPTACGAKAQTSTSDDSSGEPVRWWTRIDRATSAASFPAVETAWAANTARMPGARSTAR
ncbi:hypothetical protein AB0K66_33250 [Streptomyces werraensis]|uniref:hypothetical protein n=1 Tax=Streptomyces werraensis TaxID=68284 RepID=UPI00343AD25E